MTCKEKFKRDHPVLGEADIDRIMRLDCPHNLIYKLTRPEYCTGADAKKCKACWEREYSISNGG